MSLHIEQKQTHRRREQTRDCQGLGRGIGWEFEVGRWKLLHSEQINSKALLHSTGDYVQFPGIKEYKKNVHMYTTQSFAIQQKLAQHSKSFLFFNKKKRLLENFHSQKTNKIQQRSI